MGYKILKKQVLNQNNILLTVYAPMVARAVKAGQFVIVMPFCDSERIPLTVSDWDSQKGTVSLIFSPIGETTIELSRLSEGDDICDVCGPLGKPTNVFKAEKVVVVGGGTGCAEALPIAKAFKKQGANVIALLSFSKVQDIILKNEFYACADELLITADDKKGDFSCNVTTTLQEILKKNEKAQEKIEQIFAVGSLDMMKNVCVAAKPYGVKTVVSMNPIMMDGTGLCGGCRLTVGGKRKLACIDGPDFDGAAVDFDELITANQRYADYEKYRREKSCNLLKNAEQTNERFLSDNARGLSFDEAEQGFTKEQAVAEAKRCLRCKKPMCVSGCPINNDIPSLIAAIAQEKFDVAYEIINKTNSLPSVTGRVCPQEFQCEGKCVLGIKGKPMAIGKLERFVADMHEISDSEKLNDENYSGVNCNSGTLLNKNDSVFSVKKANVKVAVIGSGPCGLTAAGELAKAGCDVTVFEALHKAGGVLTYGIPSFRLPKDIVEGEIQKLSDKGVKFVYNAVAGKTFTIDDLKKRGYKAIIVGSGAGSPKFMNIKGENLKGVSSANDFLMRINLMGAFKKNSKTPVFKGGHTVVVGGGNVAMDAACSALRLGSQVTVVYRRTQKELPARRAEYDNALKEGAEFLFLTNPVAVSGDEKGFVKAITVQKMLLGSPDRSGRAAPVPVENSEYQIPCDRVIMALGTDPSPLIQQAASGIFDSKGRIIVDDDCATAAEGVFAGGDAVSGAATVVLAIKTGKKAAQSAIAYINSSL